MLILTSNGLSNSELLEEVKSYVYPDSKKGVIITTASEYKENDKHIPKNTLELHSLGLSVDYFDIEFEAPEMLFQYDVILINGGNPFYLLKQLKEKNCTPIFKDLIECKVVIGSSAGSIVFQETIELVAQYSPEMNVGVGLQDLTGMNLTNQEILPHYTRFMSRFERFEECAKEYELANQKSVIRLDDGHGVFITQDSFYIF